MGNMHLIDRNKAYEVLSEYYHHKTEEQHEALREALNRVPDAQGWIEVKTRPMTEEEKEYYSDTLGVDPEYYGGYMFDCQMPEDGQRVWVQTKNGYIFDDVCDRDDFIGLDGNGDWDDIVAWMPVIVPELWKGAE